MRFFLDVAKAKQPKQPKQRVLTRKPRHLFVDMDGQVLATAGLGEKWQRDTVRQHLGESALADSLPGVHPEDTFTALDLSLPIGTEPLKPARDNPICLKCGLCFETDRPFLDYVGSDDPLVTVVFDSVSRSEAKAGGIASSGSPHWLATFIDKHAASTGVPLDRVRWVPSTRCGPSRSGRVNDYKTSGRWCRHFLVQDLMLHPPKVVMAVGSVALGMLSHKSDANIWTGRELTWRGWPDEWVSDPRFMLPRKKAALGETSVTGHPMFGKFQRANIVLYPILAPYMVAAAQNEQLSNRWKEQIKRGLALAATGPTERQYVLPWYEITEDPARIEAALQYLIDHPGTLVAYDTETTGLKAWSATAAIVFMMFRWEDGSGMPQAIGFPWNFDTSGVRPHIGRLAPTVLKALYASKLAGHNLAFDILFTYATVPGADLHLLTAAMACDSWHMAYVRRQQRGSLGLDSIAYDHVPELAGYEEEMTLLIQLHSATMDPADGLGGHYANAPRDKWETHLKPYVMGDVEVCYRSVTSLQAHLSESRLYRIPMSSVTERGQFRRFTPPSRDWVYHNIMAPADQLLTRMMGRGQCIDTAEVKEQEEMFPKQIVEHRQKMAEATPAVEAWIDRQERTVEDFEFDLEDKKLLKTVLFGEECLGLPVQRLTKQGQKKYGEDVDLRKLSRDELFEYAAVDKFTLNKLAADHEEVRPLQAYRKVHKLYTTYVRPVRGHFNPIVDKKRRLGDPHLCSDGMIHGQFRLTGTRSGRLCVAGDTLLEVRVDGVEKVVEISDLWKHNLQHVTVRTHTGAWKRIKNLFFKGQEEMWEVSTGSGGKLKGTAGHACYTRRGWVCLGEATRWDEFLIDLGSAARASAYRGQLQALGLGKEAGFSEGQSAYFSPGGTSELESLSAASGGTRHTSPCSLGGHQAWKHERPSSAIGYAAGAGAGGTAGPWGAGGEYRQALRDFSVFSPTEHQGVWVAPIGKRPGQGARHDRAQSGRGSQGLAGDTGRLREVFDGQACLLFGSLQGLHEAAGYGLVPEGHVSSAAPGAQGAFWRDGRDLVVDEPARAGIVTGTLERWDSSSEGVCLRREQASGLCFDRDEHSGRVRRGVSYQKRGCGATGFDGAAGLPPAEFHSEAGAVRHADSDGDDSFRFERAEQITYAGVQEVWDIEVEEDHSYVAQGFVNHNSSNDPNLQQLPSDAIIKRQFISRFGVRGCLYGSDLSQIELRLMAAVSGDPGLLKAYFEGLDLHTLTASRLYKTDYEVFTKGYMEKLQAAGRGDEAKKLDLKRKVAKTTNFLTGYGGGAFGLQTALANNNVYLPFEECESIIDRFFESYPVLARYLSFYKKFIEDNAVACSVFGRIRVFEEVRGEDYKAKAKALRAGCNHLIQATASDLMLICMTVIEGLMRQANLESILVSTIHDSLVIDAIRDELPQVHAIVDEVVNNMPGVLSALFGETYDTSWMICPLGGDAEVGKNYLDMAKLSKVPDWDEVGVKLLAA